MDKVITLKDLSVRIESLEAEIKKLKEVKPVEKKKAPVKTPAKPADVKDLLTQLDKAKKAGDTKSSFKIRRNLRKAGYSLRDANGKK